MRGLLETVIVVVIVIVIGMTIAALVEDYRHPCLQSHEVLRYVPMQTTYVYAPDGSFAPHFEPAHYAIDTVCDER